MARVSAFTMAGLNNLTYNPLNMTFMNAAETVEWAAKVDDEERQSIMEESEQSVIDAADEAASVDMQLSIHMPMGTIVQPIDLQKGYTLQEFVANFTGMYYDPN